MSIEEGIAKFFSANPIQSNFNVNTADYTGILHDEYRTRLVQLAISDPKSYFKLRENVLATVKKEAVETQYKVYYNLLHAGTNKDGNKIDTPMGEQFSPSVPMQECNKFALAAAKTINEIAEKAVEMIIPLNYKDIAESRVKKQTEGNLGFA